MSDFIEEQKSLGVQEAYERFFSPQQIRPQWTEIDPPTTPTELASLVRNCFGLSVPARALCPNHNAPLDYLTGSFFDQADLLIWANRGGGKTLLAAVATILDALFHGPMRIVVLGGSFDQSHRLAEYIRAMLHHQPQLVIGKPTRQCVQLVGGSDIQMLAQSQRAIRGQHVQKIRCDEVDLFDAEVWEAVQFATRSAATARGSIEVLSTLHRPGGLMQKLVDGIESGRKGTAGYRLIRWCLWDVIERCGPQRHCRQCLLAEDCRGIARRAKGFYRIDDAISIKARSSRAAWQAEMLCQGAHRQYRVFPEFDRTRHVRTWQRQSEWPTYRAIDFGYRNPLVCLWIQISPDGCVHVVDEYVRARLPLAQHAAEILRQSHGPVAMTYVDPAGRQREATSGAACTEMLTAAGIPCAWRGSTIVEGLELIRSALAPAAGQPRLVISETCARLIEAFENYHYEDGTGDRPAKDGPDHLIDALRYFFINRMRPDIEVLRTNY